jgi:hypothetical protein
MMSDLKGPEIELAVINVFWMQDAKATLASDRN